MDQERWASLRLHHLPPLAGRALLRVVFARHPFMVDVPSPPPEPSAQGTLAKTPLPHLLIYALDRRLSGTIELVAPHEDGGTILVIDGQPTKARTVRPTAHLGRVLLDLGLLTDEQLNGSLVTLAREKRLHGEILLEAGFIDEEKLELGLRAQLVRKMQALVHLPPETTFSYYDGFDALTAYGGDGHVGIDPFPIVWMAIREEPPWEQVHAALTKLGTLGLFLAPGAETARFTFDKGERATVELLKSRAYRLHELTGAGTLSPRLAQLLVYCLLITKQVELVRESLLPAPESRPSSSSLTRAPEAPPSSSRTRRASEPPPSPAQVARVQLTQREIAKNRTVVEETSDYLPPDDRRTPRPKPALLQVPEASAHPPQLPLDARPKPTFRAAKETKDPGTPAGLTPQLESRRREIMDRAASIDSEDYFHMLGVAQDAEPQAVQAAFFGMAKTWHPDRVPSPISDVKDQCARVFSRLSEAHQTLTDAQKRGRYLTLLKQQGAKGEESQTEVARVVDAATDFQKAEIFLKRNDLVQAEELCRKAIAGDGEQADYHALLAWLQSMKPDRQSEEALAALVEELTRALAMNKMCERAYFYRGMLLKRWHKEESAVRDFRRAFELNKRNIDAQREVRLFEMRRGATLSPGPTQKGGKAEEKGGLFGKLFKK
jgi:tetratricopeptide (TPR) repeat protein